MLETAVVSVLLPAVVDMVKSGVSEWWKKRVGLSVDDQVKIDAAATDRIKALAELDKPYGTPSQWVTNFRAIFRYAIATLLIILGLVVCIFGIVKNNKEIWIAGIELMFSPFGFIFGERMYLSFTGRPK